MKKLLRKIKFRTWFSLILLIVLGGLFVIKLLIAQNARAAWFDNSWSFRQKIPVTAHTSAETNVYFTPNTFDSSDTTKFQADCGDLRFTDANGNLLPYFVSSGCGTATTTIHVLVVNFPAGAQDFYMYYGNPSATNGFSSTDFATAATGVTQGSNGAEELGLGPTLWWRFNEATGTTVNDASGNSDSGTLGGTTVPTWQTDDFCVTDKCLFFDGSTSKVTVSKVSKALKSVSLWVRPSNFTAAGTLVDFDGGTHKLSVAITTGVVTATGFTSPTYYLNGVSVTTLTLVANQWNYVTVTTGTSFDTTASFTVETDGTNKTKGFIDEIKFYNYVRSAAQAKTDYIQAAGKIGSSAVEGFKNQSYLSNGLVGYWNLNENTGTTANDLSGNGNTGTLNNSPLWVTGKFGNALDFLAAGNTASVSITQASSINNLPALTVTAWTYARTAGGSNIGRLILKGNNSNNGWLIRSSTTNTIRFQADFATTNL